MSVELIKKPIVLNEMTKRENVQVIKERDLIVPDGKPDIQRVLQLDGKVDINQVDVSDDRATHKGQIDISILYLTGNNSNTIYTMKGSIPIEDFVVMEGLERDQRVDFDYNIEHISWNILNERKINVKTILQIELSAARLNEATIITDIASGLPIQKRDEQIEVVKMDVSREEKIKVKEEITLSKGKPSIGEILKVDAKIQDEQIKRADDEIAYNGMIEAAILYKPAGAEDTVEMISQRLPFAGSIEIKKKDDEVYWDCLLDVTPGYMQVSPDYDGEDRVIEAEFFVAARYATYDRLTEKVIKDVYCPGKKIQTTQKNLDYMNLVAKSNVSVPKKEVLTIENTTPENNQIFSVCMKPIIEEKTPENDKLTIKGMLETKVIYISKEGPNKIDAVTNIIPFSQEIQAIGINKNMIIIPRVIARDIKVINQTRGEVVVDYLLDYMVEGYSQDSLPTLEQIDIFDMTKEDLAKYPSITVYLVKQGDTLWELAKKYNTTVKDIQELNGLDLADPLHPGQKILIVKNESLEQQ